MKKSVCTASLLVCFLLLGCTPEKPKGDLPPLHSAKGKLIRSGTTINTGILQLKPEPAKVEFNDLIINAEVKHEGTFELSTLHAVSTKKALGVPAGTYKVTFTPISDQQGGGPIEIAKPVTIKEGPNDLTIELPKR